jgi:hypothetical protein
MGEPKREPSGSSEHIGGPVKITKENAKELGRRGGKNTTAKKRMANALRARKWCNQTCPLYPCPYQIASHAREKEYKGRCALKAAPLKMQERIVNLFLKGRDGALRELTAVICDLAMRADADKSVRSKGLYCDKLMKFIEISYGRVEKIEHSGSIGGSTSVADIQKMYEELYGSKNTGSRAGPGEQAQKGRKKPK